MTDDGMSSEESGFNLAEEILVAFQFLTQDYGFRIRQVNREWPCWVRYESENVFVFVVDERMHYDLNVSVGQRKAFHTHEFGYSIQSIMEAAEAPVPRELWNFQTSSDEVARKFLRRLASYLQEYGHPALGGDRPSTSGLKSNKLSKTVNGFLIFKQRAYAGGHKRHGKRRNIGGHRNSTARLPYI